MILRQFPGHDPSHQRSSSSFAFFHQQNVIVHARSRHVAFPEHTAPLSLKATLRGREVYEINGSTLAVKAQSGSNGLVAWFTERVEGQYRYVTTPKDHNTHYSLIFARHS